MRSIQRSGRVPRCWATWKSALHRQPTTRHRLAGQQRDGVRQQLRPDLVDARELRLGAEQGGREQVERRVVQRGQDRGRPLGIPGVDDCEQRADHGPAGASWNAAGSILAPARRRAANRSFERFAVGRPAEPAKAGGTAATSRLPAGPNMSSTVFSSDSASLPMFL